MTCSGVPKGIHPGQPADCCLRPSARRPSRRSQNVSNLTSHVNPTTCRPRVHLHGVPSAPDVAFCLVGKQSCNDQPQIEGNAFRLSHFQTRKATPFPAPCDQALAATLLHVFWSQSGYHYPRTSSTPPAAYLDDTWRLHMVACFPLATTCSSIFLEGVSELCPRWRRREILTQQAGQKSGEPWDGLPS